MAVSFEESGGVGFGIDIEKYFPFRIIQIVGSLLLGYIALYSVDQMCVIVFGYNLFDCFMIIQYFIASILSPGTLNTIISYTLTVLFSAGIGIGIGLLAQYILLYYSNKEHRKRKEELETLQADIKQLLQRIEAATNIEQDSQPR